MSYEYKSNRESDLNITEIKERVTKAGYNVNAFLLDHAKFMNDTHPESRVNRWISTR